MKHSTWEPHVPLLVVTVLCCTLAARSQDFCGSFVSDGSLMVTTQTLEELKALNSTFQDLVECLNDGGLVLFHLRTFKVDVTIIVNRAIQFHSTSVVRTRLICNNRPLFDIRAREVVLSHLALWDCVFSDAGQSDGTISPVIVRQNAEVSLRLVSFVRNNNNMGPAAITASPNSKIDIRDSHFSKNIGREASVLKAGAGSEVSIANSTFQLNEGAGGVAILVDSSRLYVSGSNFTENIASHRNGAAIHVKGNEVETKVTIGGGSRYEDNRAEDGDGGALSIAGKVALQIEGDVRFVRNFAALRGGAVYARDSPDIIVDGPLFVENSSNFSGGGAVFVENGVNIPSRLQIRSALFSGNVARNYLGSGGGLRVRGVNVSCVVSDSTMFSGNWAELNGAGMHVSGVASLHVSETVFVGNHASNGGSAALSVQSTGSFTTDLMLVGVSSSTFLFNKALYSSRGGGAVGLTGAGTVAAVADSVFFENDSGTGTGGGVCVFWGPSSTIVGCQFHRNKASSGGALFVQKDATQDLRNSLFRNNTAKEGGAVRAGGEVNLHIFDCIFTNNAAAKEGGAIKVLSFAVLGNEPSSIIVQNCTVKENQAGLDPRRDALVATETLGGGITVFGNGIDIEVRDSNFTENKASRGGAIIIGSVAECNIAGNNIFKRNSANFGGGIFVAVDESLVQHRYPMYLFDKALFVANEAEVGGGVYVGNTRISFGGTSFNAQRLILRLSMCEFRLNRARRSGGGFAVSGTAVEIVDTLVIKLNKAFSEIRREIPAQGGGIRVENGAILRIKNSSLEGNSANVGGAISLFDASLETIDVHFDRNKAERGISGGGVGGAVAIEVSPDKDIATLNRRGPLVGAIFQGLQCTFSRNSAALRGGALHLHHVDPDASLAFDDGCKRDRLLSFCLERQKYLNRLIYRSVALHRVSFIHNRAQAGGAVFTNDARMLNASVKMFQHGRSLADVWSDERFLEEAGLRFENNANNVEGFVKGYGADFATTPTRPVLTTSHDSNHAEKSHLVIENFFSGSQLNFTIVFKDALGQTVDIPMNFTASIVHVPLSGNETMELFGQLTAQMDDDRRMSFRHTTLRGTPNTAYHLRIDYESTDSALTYAVQSSNVTIIMRPCRPGERTVREGNVTECEACRIGTFGKHPQTENCTSCANMRNGNCNGKTVVPDVNFWHATSASLEMQKCIGAESCDYLNRADEIQRNALMSHHSGSIVYYINDSNALCNTGYKGPLCGSCERGYGRVNLRCLKCGESSVQYLFLFSVVVWSIALLSYFIKTVLGLPFRIDSNRKFQQKIPVLRNTVQHHLRIAEERRKQRSCRNSLNCLQQPEAKDRKGNFGKRLVKLAGDSTSDIQLLTIANPAAEVLKIIINFLQVTASAVSIAVRWTDQVRGLLNALGVMGNTAAEQNFLSLDCIMDWHIDDKAVHRMTVAVLQPVAFLCVYCLFWAFVKFKSRDPEKSFRQRLWLTYLAINYFAYISTTKNLLRFLACVNVSDSEIERSQNGLYWQEDTAVMCYKDKHAGLVGLMVVPLLCIVTLGFPIGTAYILISGKDKLDDERFTATYGFLYSAYTKPYWELVIILRKATVAAVAVFSHLLGQNIQAFLCILVLIIALCLQLAAQPFIQELDQLNRLETISLSCTIVVFVVSLTMSDPRNTTHGQVFLTAVMYLVVLGALGAMLKELVLAAEEFVDMKILQDELMDATELIDAGLIQKGQTLIGAWEVKIRSYIRDAYRFSTDDSNDTCSDETMQSARREVSESVSSRFRRLTELPK